MNTLDSMETMIVLKSLRNAIYAVGGLSFCCDSKSVVGEQCEAIDKAINAVKKTIPQKVTHEATLLKRCTCPRCKKNVVDEFTEMFGRKIRVTVTYCNFCGQALDWSDYID